MATVAGIKIKTKAAPVRRIALADEKYTGPEPIWPEDALTWDADKFDSKLKNLIRKK